MAFKVKPHFTLCAVEFSIYEGRLCLCYTRLKREQGLGLDISRVWSYSERCDLDEFTRALNVIAQFDEL